MRSENTCDSDLRFRGTSKVLKTHMKSIENGKKSEKHVHQILPCFWVALKINNHSCFSNRGLKMDLEKWPKNRQFSCFLTNPYQGLVAKNSGSPQGYLPVTATNWSEIHWYRSLVRLRYFDDWCKNNNHQIHQGATNTVPPQLKNIYFLRDLVCSYIPFRQANRVPPHRGLHSELQPTF